MDGLTFFFKVADPGEGSGGAASPYVFEIKFFSRLSPLPPPPPLDPALNKVIS